MDMVGITVGIGPAVMAVDGNGWSLLSLAEPLFTKLLVSSLFMFNNQLLFSSNL
jgi:hypothetical protein